jgi:glucosamine-phosphate N-acetyltransferase
MGRSDLRFDYRNFQLEDFPQVSNLVSELTKTEMWQCHFSNNDYHCLVAYVTEDCKVHNVSKLYYNTVKAGDIIGFASMFLLRKIFWPQPVAQIEDVVVNSLCQGCCVGKTLVTELKIRAKRLNAYKVVLNCNQDNIPFYKKLGFRQAEGQMRLDLRCGKILY